MTVADHGLAAAYALNALDPDERTAFEHHLATCEECVIDVREMTAATSRFALAESAEPPGGLRDRVLALAERTPQAGPNTTVVPMRRRSGSGTLNRWLAGVAAAAVLVAGALGVTAYQANQEADQLQATASQVNAILTDPASQRVTTDVSGGGTGTFIVSRQNRQGVLVTTGITDLSSDQTYQLWAINDSGAQSIGLYHPDPQGDGTQLVNFPDSAQTFGMTVEPASGSEQPTTDPVLLIPFNA